MSGCGRQGAIGWPARRGSSDNPHHNSASVKKRGGEGKRTWRVRGESGRGDTRGVRIDAHARLARVCDHTSGSGQMLFSRTI